MYQDQSMQRADLLLTTAQIGMALAGFAGLAEPISWRISSAAYAVVSIVLLLHSIRRNRSSMDRVLVAGPVTGVLMVACAGLALVLGLNAVGVFRGFESGVYFGGLFFHFLAASFFFIRLLYGAFPEGPAS